MKFLYTQMRNLILKQAGEKAKKWYHETYEKTLQDKNLKWSDPRHLDWIKLDEFCYYFEKEFCYYFEKEFCEYSIQEIEAQWKNLKQVAQFDPTAFENLTIKIEKLANKLNYSYKSRFNKLYAKF